jgi:hypothetical protein
MMSVATISMLCCVVILNVVMLSVILLKSVTMLNFVLLSVVMLILRANVLKLFTVVSYKFL